ncbi:MAG: rhomboid family intramembrane serine protease [Candidatus Zixiibacteriota bacterium]
MRSFNSYKGGLGGFQGMRIGPGSISPVIKYLLIANGAIFLLQGFSALNLTNIFGLTPARIYSDFPNNMYMLYQTVTYMFLHGGFFHLFFNMFALWMFGTEIEYTWGSRSFFKFYMYCGLGGALLSLMFNYNLPYPIIGASGAIYGILAAYWIMFPERYLLIFFMFPMKVRYAIPLFAILNFIASGTNVAHLAHLGGAIVGLAYLKLDWHVKGPLKWFNRVKYKRQTAKQAKKRMQAEEVMQRVDSILDKINEVGLENISSEDRKFLEDASHILSNNDEKR